MVKTSVLNDCLNAINNAEKAGKRQVMIRPSSKVIVKFLTVMQRHGRSTFFSLFASFSLYLFLSFLHTRMVICAIRADN
jgi:ribosomal protein S8